MKKLELVTVILILTFFISGCDVMVLPNSDTIGKSKKFEKDGITITLTDKFEEQISQVGFDGYYVSEFCGVMVKKEDFSLEEGLKEEELSEYIEGVISNNGHTDIVPKNEDGLWYYVKDTENMRYYAYCYKGTEAFWIVQFACYNSDISWMESQIFLWAKAIEVE